MKITRNQLDMFHLLPPAPKKEWVNLLVEIFILRCAIESWKVIGESIRTQAVRSKKRHRVCQHKRFEREATEKTAEYRRLEQVSKLEYPLPASNYLRATLISRQPV